jgi:hypothetical protein
MRSIALVSTFIVALVGMAPMASAAPRNHTHRVQPGYSTGSIHRVQPGYVTGSVRRLPSATVGYPRADLWPHCYGGPACTAAGYPNLHYLREIQGLPMGEPQGRF